MNRRAWWVTVHGSQSHIGLSSHTHTHTRKHLIKRGFPTDSVVKNLPANAGAVEDWGPTSGSGRSPGGGNGNPLQYSCLGNPKDRGTWQATKSQTRLSRHIVSQNFHRTSLGLLKFVCARKEQEMPGSSPLTTPPHPQPLSNPTTGRGGMSARPPC